MLHVDTVYSLGSNVCTIGQCTSIHHSLIVASSDKFCLWIHHEKLITQANFSYHLIPTRAQCILAEAVLPFVMNVIKSWIIKWYSIYKVNITSLVSCCDVKQNCVNLPSWYALCMGLYDISVWQLVFDSGLYISNSLVSAVLKICCEWFYKKDLWSFYVNWKKKNEMENAVFLEFQLEAELFIKEIYILF